MFVPFMLVLVARKNDCAANDDCGAKNDCAAKNGCAASSENKRPRLQFILTS